MLKIGKYNNLTILRDTKVGLFLGDAEKDPEGVHDVLLPNKYVPNEFEIGENSPDGVLTERLVSTAFLWHNYGNSTIGSKEDIERVKANTLRVFYEKYYQPDNATLIVGGNFNTDKALEYIATYFSTIKRPTRALAKTYTVEPAQDGERYVELKRNGDVQ